MSELELLLVGACRFMAWVGLIATACCYCMIALQLRRDHSPFFVPAMGVSIEAASWALHQFGWWMWHLSLVKHAGSHAAPEVAQVAAIANEIAGVAYVGTAVGGVMVLQPFLVRRAKSYPWYLLGGGLMTSIWVVGYSLALAWVPQ